MRTAFVVMVLGSVVIIGAAGALESPAASAAPGQVDLGSSSASSTVRSVCGSLTLDRWQSTVPHFAGSPANLAYGCGWGGFLPAFVTGWQRGAGSVTVTPTFVLPSGWTLSLGRFSFFRECSPGGRLTPLESGSPVTLAPLAGYVYCLSTAHASSFSRFSITWSA